MINFNLRKVKDVVVFTSAVLGLTCVIFLQQEISNTNEALEEKEKRIEVLENIIQQQENQLKEYEKFERILDDLSAIPESAKPFVISLCFTESSLNYNVKHRGRFDKTTTGICGIKPELWKDVIGDNSPNSLYSGYLVLKHLLDKHQNLFDAVARYKGAKTNFITTERVIDLSKKIVVKFF